MLRFAVLGLAFGAASASAAMSKGFNQLFDAVVRIDVREIAFEDGAKLFLGPKEVMGIQQNLGSDIAMVLDECPPWPCERDACAKAVARRLRTGQVEVNGGGFNPMAPFGGYKQSGNGREFGAFGLEEFLEVKAMQL